MKNGMSRVGQALCSLGLFAVIGVGVVALVSRPAFAAARPLCGYSTLWDCTMPDGSHRTVGGTPCDIQRFQQQTGAHCVRSGL
jgi:hypothetical protein